MREYDEYRFEMYQRGHVVHRTGNLTLEQAQNFYMNNYTQDGIRLFINDEKIPYTQTAKRLQLNKSQIFQTYFRDAFPGLPRTVRG